MGERMNIETLMTIMRIHGIRHLETDAGVLAFEKVRLKNGRVTELPKFFKIGTSLKEVKEWLGY